MTKQEKNRSVAKKDIEDRIQVLSNKKKLIPAWEKELEALNKVIAKFDEYSNELFSDVPGYGLAKDWATKLI